MCWLDERRGSKPDSAFWIAIDHARIEIDAETARLVALVTPGALIRIL